MSVDKVELKVREAFGRFVLYQLVGSPINDPHAAEWQLVDTTLYQVSIMCPENRFWGSDTGCLVDVVAKGDKKLFGTREDTFLGYVDLTVFIVNSYRGSCEHTDTECYTLGVILSGIFCHLMYQKR